MPCLLVKKSGPAFDMCELMLVPPIAILQVACLHVFFSVHDPVGEISCDGREVKALDSKSNGVSPRRFEPCSQRRPLLQER